MKLVHLYAIVILLCSLCTRFSNIDFSPLITPTTNILKHSASSQLQPLQLRESLGLDTRPDVTVLVVYQGTLPESPVVKPHLMVSGMVLRRTADDVDLGCNAHIKL
jgi:hypothetical protein